MSLNFFYTLRAEKVPTGPREYLDFLKVIDHSLNTNDSFDSKRFYNLARASLVKDVSHYDGFDLAFSRCFSGAINLDTKFRDQLENWLRDALEKELNLEAKKQLKIFYPKTCSKNSSNESRNRQNVMMVEIIG